MAAKTQFGDEAEVAVKPGKTMFGDDAEDGANPAASPAYAPPVPKPALPKELQSSSSDTPIRPRMGNVSDSTQMSRQEDRESHGMTAPAHPIPLARIANRAVNAFGEMAAPAAIPALALAPAATIGAGLLGAAGKYGGETVAKSNGADPDTAELIGNAASLPMSSIGGATFESPVVRGFARGAASAVPQAIKDATLPGAAAILGHGGHVAEAATAISATPAIVRGGMNGARGKPLAGPVMRSLMPEVTPIERHPAWQGMDEPLRVTPPPVEPIRGPLPSGRTVGGMQNVPPPASPPNPRTPIWAGMPESQNPGFPAVQPISRPLPSGRVVGGAHNIVPGQFAPPVESQIIAPSLETRLQAPAPQPAAVDYTDLLRRSVDQIAANKAARGLPVTESSTVSDPLRIPIRTRRR